MKPTIAVMRAVVFWLLLLIVMPRSIRADGMTFKSTDSSIYVPLIENCQAAAIFHDQGRQEMVIAINIHPDDGERSLWILPLPSSPDQISIDLAESFPQFQGTDPRPAARKNISMLLAACRATQIYSLVMEIFTAPIWFGSKGSSKGIFVYAKTNRWGLHAEIVSAETSDDLKNYLKMKNCLIKKESLTSFDSYFGKGYAFILTWIDSVTELRQAFPKFGSRLSGLGERWPCLRVVFPTKEAFYPLRPTSGYGKEEVPVTLYVAGFVQARTSADLEQHLSVKHFLSQLENGFDNGGIDMPDAYTRIEIRTKAENLTDDVWFVPIWLPSMTIAPAINWVFSSWWTVVILGFLITGLISCLSSTIAAKSLFGSSRGFTLYGLCNIFTILGLIIALRFVREPQRSLLHSPAQGLLGPTTNRHRFFVRFSIIFLILCLVIQMVLLYILSF